MNFMGYIIDLIALGIVVVTVFLSAKHGFVRTLVEVVGFVAALIIAFNVSTPLAETTYTKVLEPQMLTAAQSAAQTGGQGTADALWSAMPKFITDNGFLGVTYENVSSTVNDATTSDAVQQAVKSTSRTLVMPVAVKLLSMLFATVIFVVLLIVVKIAARFLNKLFSFSIIGTANRALGGVLGVFKGLLVAAAVCMIISVLVSYTGGFWVFTPKALSNSYLLNFISNIF